MSNMSEDIQYASSDSCPPMLDRTNFESCQQRIRLYCLGKDNGENIMKSINKGPERDRVFIDLLTDEKEMYKADIHATNILLQADQCDAFDSDVDEASTTQTMFMENLTFEDPIYNEVGPSYVSNTPSEVQDHDKFADNVDAYHEVHELQNDVQRNYVVDSDAEYTSDSNIIRVYKVEELQEKDNVIINLKVQVSKMNNRSGEANSAKDVKDLELTEYVNALLEQNEHFRAENEKTSSLLTEIANLKDQLKSKVSCVTMNSVKPKVLAPGMYAIDVVPIPPRLKNNMNANVDYINHLKESVGTVCEIVEEARIAKPIDNVLDFACRYTKLSQELLEYVIGTCPKEVNKINNKAASTPLTRKNCSTEASKSKPGSNTKNNRILPDKSENKMKVEDHPRTNKYRWEKVNRVDSRISSKRVRTTGKKFTLGKHTGGYQWRPTGKLFPLGE
ncbi:hypothetical protein Tco_0807321 [Tanacetum coccineum]